MPALRGASLCFAHSPNTAARRHAARRKGGQRLRIPKASVPADVENIRALQSHIAQVLADVLLLPNTTKRALTVARLVETGRRLLEEVEVRAIIERLRDEIERQKRRMT